MPSSKSLFAFGSLIAYASAFAIPAPQVWEPPVSTTTTTTGASGSASHSASASNSASASASNSGASVTPPSTPIPISGARLSTTRAATATSTPTGISPPSSNCDASSLPSIQCFRTASSFPDSSSWLSWACLTALNYPTMLLNNNDSPTEAQNVISAIQSVAQTAGIDPRIAYAVVMQESTGKVRPIHGDNGLSAGIFQVQISKPATCDGTTYNTCPLSTITTMAQDGIYGHNGTDSAPVAPGIAYWLGNYGHDGQGVAQALRAYNTGSIPDARDLTQVQIGGKNVGTPAYVSDIANRLVGGLVGSPRPYMCEEGS